MVDTQAGDAQHDLKTLGDLRGRFRALILQNPNYFGNVQDSQFQCSTRPTAPT